MGLGVLSFLAMLVSVVVVVLAILNLDGDVMNFLNLPSFLVVIVPTIMSSVTTAPISLLAKVPAHFRVITRKEELAETQIEKIVELANKVRSGGILALEEEEIPEATMAYGVRMIVDGVQEDEIKNALAESMESIETRHFEAIALYEKAASFAPAFGMVGTVVSLVNMLLRLDFEDPAAATALGANMSTALITTLYGALMANILLLPIAARLRILHRREMFNKSLICTGLMAIQHGNSPTFIYELLCEQLNAEKRKNVSNSKGGKGGE